MRVVRSAFIAFFILSLFTIGTPSPARSKHSARAFVSSSVREMARRLAKAWVDTASRNTIDSLAQRSIAFSGMVPGVFVVLDGKRFSATQALTDSGLTILGKHDEAADAGAMRNIVYTLNEIAEGRSKK